MITQFSDLGLETNRILGVTFKELRTFPDQRGFFRELIRHNDEFFGDAFAQWSHSKMAHNTVKSWHFHHLQIDWWYVPIGVVHAVLFDDREESPSFGKKIEFKLGDSALDDQALADASFDGFRALQPDDIADAVMYALEAPWRVNVSTIEISPTEQYVGGVFVAPVEP